MVKHMRAIRTTKSWDEKTIRQVEGGPKITGSVVSYDLTGAIEGDSNLAYSMVYLSSSKAMFLGYEQVQGAFEGRPGTFVLRHEGTFENGVATIEVQVVPESGTGALVGLSGKGCITTDSTDPSKSTLELDAELP
jgi:hypothetical protein